tara:strand:- start:18 stop:830 length:813 start_codon:yes stop_codon:yes gene_type:complete
MKNGQLSAKAGQRIGPTQKLRGYLIATAKAVLPLRVQSWVRSVLTGQVFKPAMNRVNMGDLRRLTPISRQYGYDRGTPIDRYYIEQFLNAHSSCIRGNVLEISEDTYTKQFGGTNVDHIDVLHYNDPRPPATMTGDLTDAPHLPSNHYDCIIITQTLMLIYDVPAAVATLHRILKPGGTVLVTLSGLSQIADPGWLDTWHWGFTQSSSRRLFEDGFPDGQVEVVSYGNVLSTIAFLQGLAQEELTTKELEHNDPEYQMLIAVAARKKPDA